MFRVTNGHFLSHINPWRPQKYVKQPPVSSLQVNQMGNDSGTDCCHLREHFIRLLTNSMSTGTKQNSGDG